MDDLKTGKEFWEEAKDRLGFTKEHGYQGLLCNPSLWMGWQAIKHGRRCDDLSRRIARETGQAGIIQFFIPYDRQGVE